MAGLRELCSPSDLRAAAGGEALLLWAAADLPPGTRAFTLGAATAVAAPALCRRDRLAVTGPAEDAAALVRAVLPQVGPTFRPVGDEGLVRDLSDRVPEVEFVEAFGWMQTGAPAGRAHTTPGGTASLGGTASRDGTAAWLPASEDGDVTTLLDVEFRTSYARPGLPGVRRWAGVRDADGSLLACAADAWSAPRVGFLAGVVTAERARGRGLAAAVCRFVVDALVAEHGTVALMVDSWNAAAVQLYRRLGFSWRSVGAAHVAKG